MLKTPAYVIISLVFFILIGIGLAYSYFFYPNTHPVDCMVKAYTGQDCPSCGFSRAFSYYMHFQFKEGKSYNALSYHVFLFFLAQFFIRMFVLFYYFISGKHINLRVIKIDATISILWFLLAFLPVVLNF